MDHVFTLLLAGLGAVCIYFGYRLFCDLPVLRRQGAQPTRAAVILLNIVPGALLALFGAALFTTEARGMLAPRPGTRYQVPSTEGTSWHGTHFRPLNRAA